MQFLSQAPALALSEEGGKQSTFCADVFQPRPPFEEVQSFAAWSDSAQAQMEEALQRNNCPVSWVALYVDEAGMLAVIQFKHRLILGHAKTSAEAVLHALPEKQRRAVELGLRPLDELDALRIKAWKTVGALRPNEDDSSDSSAEEEEAEISFVPTGAAVAEAPPAAPTLAELLAKCDESAPKRRRLTYEPCTALAPVPPQHSDLALLSTDWKARWAYLAQQSATVRVASAGLAFLPLSYIRCHREARRVKLLVERVRVDYEKASLLTVVRVAAQLAKDGRLPSFEGPRARKTEFVRRCQEAHEALSTGVVRTTALPEAVKRQIAAILGGEEPEWPVEGCLGCGHKKPGWATRTMRLFCPGDSPTATISRCNKCRLPYTYGRTWNGQLVQCKRVSEPHRSVPQNK